MKNKSFIKITLLFLLILCAFSASIIYFKSKYTEAMEEELLEIAEKKVEIIEEDGEKSAISIEEGIGLILIPSLDIKAPIYEGTTSDVLKYSVGHFTNTSLWEGNVGLASHNGGLYAHYFSRIHELENGEEIIYITNIGERRYEVTENKVIEETNVEILEDTLDNTITLITCEKGKSNKRRCVIGKEI